MMKHLDRIEEYIMLVTFPVMFVIVLVATFSRYLNLFSMSWGEEVARYLMIWLGFAGIGYGFKKNAHLGLSFVVDKCPAALRRFLVLVRALLIILFGVLISWFSYLILSKQFAFSQHSPSLGIPMWAIYLAVFVGGVLTIVRTTQLLFGYKTSVEDDNNLHLEGQ
ncbi:C4-dicarboxylate ABC transporter permease [Betaproteobacteria bacterium]|nr:C4-dicarboxylate ABC transporter permease [Betaproteobacteria bacterium]